jgi:hypothetical protein
VAKSGPVGNIRNSLTPSRADRPRNPDYEPFRCTQPSTSFSPQHFAYWEAPHILWSRTTRLSCSESLGVFNFGYMLGYHTGKYYPDNDFTRRVTISGLQIVIIITMLILTGVHFRSTNDPNLSEWKACDRPLGIWASIWIIRVVLASILGYWEYRRNRVLFVNLLGLSCKIFIHPISADTLHAQTRKRVITESSILWTRLRTMLKAVEVQSLWITVFRRLAQHRIPQFLPTRCSTRGWCHFTPSSCFLAEC